MHVLRSGVLPPLAAQYMTLGKMAGMKQILGLTAADHMGHRWCPSLAQRWARTAQMPIHGMLCHTNGAAARV